MKEKDRTLSILTHLLGIFSYLFGALFIFIFTKDKEVREHARIALNWQISLALYYVAIRTLSSIFSLSQRGITNFYPAFPFEFVLSSLTILNIVFCILAAVRANEGGYWKYPLSLKLIKKNKEFEKKLEEGKRKIKKVLKKEKSKLNKNKSKKK
jgi:uncharacterized protein